MLRQQMPALLAVVICGCTVGEGSTVVKAGDGLSVDSASGAIGVNADMVPLLAECYPGEVVQRRATGWECVKPSVTGLIMAGAGIAIENETVSVKFGSGAKEAATGDHNHDERYFRKTDAINWASIDPLSLPALMLQGDVTQYSDEQARQAVSWGSVQTTVKATDLWPGIVSVMQIPDFPVISWTTVESSVNASTLWPGKVRYSQLLDVPAMNWSSISGSVTATTTWPGKVTWDSVKDDVQATTAWPGKVAWNSVKGDVTATTDWPGTVPYSRVTGAPTVNWDNIKVSVDPTTTWPGKVSWTSVKDDVQMSTLWPGKVAWASVKDDVQATTAWPGKVAWTSVKDDVQTSTLWPGKVAWTSVKDDVTTTTDWPGTIPYARVSGAPDTAGLSTQVSTINGQITSINSSVNSLNSSVTALNSSQTSLGSTVASHTDSITTLTNATVASYATIFALPTNPADKVKAYVEANLCLYQYIQAQNRWEIINCDFYPDWTVSSGNVMTFIDQTATQRQVTFNIADGVATKDYLYGISYADASNGYLIQQGSVAADDSAAPIRLRGRWQWCGYSVSGRGLCLPYLGMLRDTSANIFEGEWSKMGTRTWTGSKNVGVTYNTTTDVSLISFTSPAATAYFVTTSMSTSSSSRYYAQVSPIGISSSSCSTGSNYSSSGEVALACLIPQIPSKVRGIRAYAYQNSVTIYLQWFDEAR